METDIKIKVCISEMNEAAGARGHSSLATTSMASYERALVVGSNGAVATASNIAVFHQKNRFRSAKKKKKKKKKKWRAQAAQIFYPVSQSSSEHRAGAKRRASFDNGSSSFDLREKLMLNQSRAETCAGRAVPLTRAIVMEAYPEEMITPEGLAMLRETFCKEIQGIQEGFVPKFRGNSMLRNGAVVLTCADEPSLNWLVERIGHISPWEGAKLRVVGLEALRRYKAVAWIPGPPSTSTSKILTLLEKQNSGLRTLSWQIIAENVAASENGRNIIFDIPESSVLFLRTLNFKLFFGLEEIVVKIERQDETPSEELVRASRGAFYPLDQPASS